MLMRYRFDYAAFSAPLYYYDFIRVELPLIIFV